MKRSFDDILSSLKTTIATYDYFVDFKKVYKNIDDLYVTLNILNSLLNSKEKFDLRFKSLIHSYPETLKAIPLLLAVRAPHNEISVMDLTLKTFHFGNPIENDDDYLRFMEQTGLKDMIANGKVTNLVDYVTGVEVGLDSNARKNRTGTTMEDIVENYLITFKELKVIRQATKKDILDKFGFDGLNNVVFKEETGIKPAEKRFDFAVNYNKHIFLIETNFYGSGGSKLNETARSYMALADQLSHIPNVSFIWITDGIGWLSAKNNLLESYNHQQSLMTIEDLDTNFLIDAIHKMADDVNNE